MKQIIATAVLVFCSVLTLQAQSVGHGADIDAQINGSRSGKQIKKQPAEQSRQSTGGHGSPGGTSVDGSSERPMKMVLRKIKVRKKPSDGDDTRVKVTTGVHHARGFRIQVYSGGNTRVARQEAERAGQKVKSVLPNQPVYVHFYCPRWSCRVGNFTSYQSALGVLRQIRKLGYKGAVVIRSNITIRDVRYID